MKMFLFRPLATFLLLFHGVVQPASLSDGGSNNRIFQGEKLSEKEHVDQENFDYDHEAFLGADEAHEFDDLDPEESKRRLGVIVDKIDEDADGLVTLDEMRKWIRFTQDRYMTQDVERQWIQHNQDGKDEIGWEEYRKLVYGFVDDGKEMEDREERRWKMADEDGNGVLSKLEFKHFLHPEEVERMRDVVVQETMEDMDKDGDGQLSEGEYIGDMYQGEEGAEPDWVWRERESFNELRDQDGDGYMNEQEVRDWIFPSNFDHVEAEARHLMAESDADGDGKLTKEEILDKSDLFVGSQVTNFGEALTRHDEF